MSEMPPPPSPLPSPPPPPPPSSSPPSPPSSEARESAADSAVSGASGGGSGSERHGLLHWATNGLKWAGGMAAGCVVDHVAAPAVSAIKGCAPQAVRDYSRLLNDFAIQGAGLLINPKVRTLLTDAVQLGGLLQKPASSPQGRQLIVELSTLSALGMDILASDSVKTLVEQVAVVSARAIDLELDKANAKVLVEKTAEVLSEVLALGKIPEAKHLLAGVTCNLVHISEMVNQPDPEKNEAPRDVQDGHKADPKKLEIKPDAEGGNQAEGGGGANHQYARHGRAALPRHDADSYLPVLQGEPLPLREKIAAPTAHSVDETLAQAAGRPRQLPRQRVARPQKPKVPTRKKTLRSKGAVAFLACLGGGLLAPCTNLVFAGGRTLFSRPSEPSVDQAYPAQYWPHPPAFSAAVATTASTTIASCGNLRGASGSSLPAHTASPEPVGFFSRRPKKSIVLENWLNQVQDQDLGQYHDQNHDEGLLHDNFVIPVGSEVTARSNFRSWRVAVLAGYPPAGDDPG